MNKVALVTGSATGIGRAVALRFARAGLAVAVNYSRSEAEAKETYESVRAAPAEPRRASDLHHRILQRADPRDADAHRVLRLKGKTVLRNNTSACQQHCAVRETLAAKKKGNQFVE